MTTEQAEAAISYPQAVAAVTGPGQRFETTSREIRGQTYTVFKNAPGSLAELLAPARQRGDAPFLVYEDETWSFATVMASVDALGRLLAEKYGVKRGDRVGIAMRNYPEWVMAFAAIVSIGATSVSLNSWWTEPELAYALQDCEAKVLIADTERVERSLEACRRLGTAILAVRVTAPIPDGVDTWKPSLQVGGGPTLPLVAIDPDDDATILYTSGTTGHPKGAVATHRSIIQALMGFGCRNAIEEVRRPTNGVPAEPPTFILIVPLFHVTGCIPVMLSSFVGGLKLVMMHRWEPERALELIERERVTNFVGVPTQSWDLLESPRFAEFDTSSLLSVGGGGAPAPPQLVKRVGASFARGKPSIGYGMTETNAYGPGNSGKDYLEHPTSTGRATPILEIQVRDPNGTVLPPGRSGEIYFKGPHLIRGYWNNPKATEEVFSDGWLRTGDLGRIDHDGFVYVEDRAKDMVVRAGENVYSVEVEAALYEHPGVYEAAVFGLPHDRLGEEVAAVVYPRPGHDLDVERLRSHLAERLASFKIPTKVAIVDHQLPRNPAGKILKRQLKEDFPAVSPDFRSGSDRKAPVPPGSW